LEELDPSWKDIHDYGGMIRDAVSHVEGVAEWLEEKVSGVDCLSDNHHRAREIKEQLDDSIDQIEQDLIEQVGDMIFDEDGFFVRGCE
jgi:Zn ribbon nucleic-acid-binding protein